MEYWSVGQLQYLVIAPLALYSISVLPANACPEHRRRAGIQASSNINNLDSRFRGMTVWDSYFRNSYFIFGMPQTVCNLSLGTGMTESDSSRRI